MEHLFLVRHGDYEAGNLELSQLGIQQMVRSARKIGQLTMQGESYIAHSDARWVVQSLDHITRVLTAATSAQHALLSKEGKHLRAGDWIQEGESFFETFYSDAAKYKAGVLLTHCEIILPLNFVMERRCQRAGGWTINGEIDRVETGSLIHYDMVQRRMSVFYNMPNGR